jgi:hypothetical protein
VCRRTAGAIEVYHTLRLLQSLKPLRPPLTGIVGGLVANFVADHLSFEIGGGGSVTSRLRGKGSGGVALRLSPCEHSMARAGGQINRVCATSRSVHQLVAGVCWGSILRAQAKEGQGRPDDANGRHWGSRLISRFIV